MADVTFLRADLEERPRTDMMLSPWLLLAMLVAAAVAFALVLFAFFLGATGVDSDSLMVAPTLMIVLVGIASTAVSLYIVYHLVGRRDRHFRRLARLAEDATVYLRSRAQEAGADLSGPLEQLERMQRTMREQAGERGALIWAVLWVLAGLAVQYVLFYVLMQDFRRHEASEVELTVALNEAFSALGAEPGIAFQPQIPERSFWLYVLLTLITFGVWNLYWLYCMMADPNRHFVAQADWETRLWHAAV